MYLSVMKYVQEAEDFVDKLSTAAGGGSAAKLRGPSLAAVDLEARKLSLAERRSSGQSASSTGQQEGKPDTPDLAAAVLRYIERVGHLASCATDLRCQSSRLYCCTCIWPGHDASGCASSSGSYLLLH